MVNKKSERLSLLHRANSSVGAPLRRWAWQVAVSASRAVRVRSRAIGLMPNGNQTVPRRDPPLETHAQLGNDKGQSAREANVAEAVASSGLSHDARGRHRRERGPWRDEWQAAWLYR